MAHTTLAADGILRHKDSKKMVPKDDSNYWYSLTTVLPFQSISPWFYLVAFPRPTKPHPGSRNAITDLFLAIKSIGTKIRESILLLDLPVLVATFGSSQTSVKSFLGSLLYLFFWCTIQSHLKWNHVIMASRASYHP